MKWLKNGEGKSLYFTQLFLQYILFGETFIGPVKVPLYSACLNLNQEKQNSNQNVKVEKMVVLFKTFDHYRKFKQKFSTKVNLNIWNSMMMFTFSGFDQKHLFGQIWSIKSKFTV